MFRLLAAARTGRAAAEIWKLLFDVSRSDVEITKGFLIAAASISGSKVFQVLLDKCGDEIKITTRVVTALEGNYWYEHDIMRLLLHRRGAEVEITRKTIISATKNTGFGDKWMQVFVDERRGDVDVNGKLLQTIIENSTCGPGTIRVLLRASCDIRISQDMVMAAAKNEETGSKWMRVSREERGDEVIITEKLIKAVPDNFWEGPKMMKLLLRARRDETKISQDTIMAAAKNEQIGEWLQVYFEDSLVDVEVIKDLIDAALANKVAEVRSRTCY